MVGLLVHRLLYVFEERQYPKKSSHAIQGRRNRVRRVRNCAPNICPNCSFHKLSGKKRIFKISQKLTEIEAKM